MKVIGSTWFSEMGSATQIGIVLVEFDKVEQQDFGAGKLSAYIGTSGGLSKEMDEEKIVKNGARFPVHAAKMMIGQEV
jgi:hypothetical protein